MRDRIFIAVFGLIFLILFYRLFQMQVIEGSAYRRKALENAAKTVPIPAARGMIYDRQGKTMVENRPLFLVEVLPQIISSKDISKKALVQSHLSRLLGKKIEFKVSAGRPIVISEVRPEVAVRIEEQRAKLEGVAVNVLPTRFYPYGNIASHLLGYVAGDRLGKDGIEKYYDKEIRGIDGGKKIEVDVHARPVRLLESLEPVAGAKVKLTIDLELQVAAEKALGGKEGGVVILNPKTGEILALVSHPNYDSNLVWKALSQGRNPFMNRALALYPPGSIFKVITLTAALEEGLTRAEENFYCPGYYRINNRIAKCWKESGHGKISAAEGLVQSCDIVFYELGKRLGANRLAEYASRYGLGEKSGIDLPQEKRGLVPTLQWKEKVRGEPWYEGDSINYGIGQGFVQVTPLQMALVYATIATGKRMRPFLVEEIQNREGTVLFRGKPTEVAPAPLSSQNLAIIRKALKEVVARGTGIAARREGVEVAGKTGTAENPGRPHAWFLCYAPSDDPQLVIASFVAHGEHGDRAAAYVARDILKEFFDSGE
jgi:penicillin-binding protein 2